MKANTNCSGFSFISASMLDTANLRVQRRKTEAGQHEDTDFHGRGREVPGFDTGIDNPGLPIGRSGHDYAGA